MYIEGPYGTPAHGMARNNHAILVAAGIGVTPFASILQSLLTLHQRTKTKGHSFADDDPDFQLKKVILRHLFGSSMN